MPSCEPTCPLLFLPVNCEPACLCAFPHGSLLVCLQALAVRDVRLSSSPGRMPGAHVLIMVPACLFFIYYDALTKNAGFKSSYREKSIPLAASGAWKAIPAQPASTANHT